MQKPSLDVIEVENQYYVKAQSSLADNQTNTLMTGDLFAVFDRRGDFRNLASTEQGLFYKEMRHLSRLVLRLRQEVFLLLSSSVRLDNAVFTADLTNPDLRLTDHKDLRRGVLHFARSSFLRENTCAQRIQVQNYDVEAVTFEVTLDLEADFADIFEVRGFKRASRGRLLDAHLEPSALTLLYDGLDGIRRETRIESNILPASVSANEMQIPISLPPGQQVELALDIRCRTSKEPPFSGVKTSIPGLGAKWGAEIFEVQIETANQQFNDWINRSFADLKMLVTETPEGLYPYAGVPWFSTIFGRDGLITGLELLWMCPEIARGVLCALASTQATKSDPDQDSEPGKILHEFRQSEMAGTKEVPFGRYYGSVDSTPLFVLLAAEYFKRTGDLELIDRLIPPIEEALHWIDHYGDGDGDGFVEYGHSSRHGLLQQGWKDSQDSVFHSDGTLAEGPIALCEVQGYVYRAKREIAEVFQHLRKKDQAAALRSQASRLKEQFHDAFWCEKLSSYALALDGQKRRCEVKSSNAGQLLLAGVSLADHRRKIVAELKSDIFHSGWGLRTIAEGQPRYNPMSYHNGSVWPHDNALIAYGLIGEKDKTLVEKILTGLFEASVFFDLHRMPELFCGLPKRTGEAPTLYPVACAPQAWAAGSVFLMLQACLGMRVDALGGAIRMMHPMLPECIPLLRIKGLRVGSARVSLEIARHHKTVTTAIFDRHGEIDVMTVK